MAARSSSRRKNPVSCGALLQKLKKGQNELKSSMKSYVRVVEEGSTTKEERHERRETKVNRRKVLFERPLNRVDDLPRKRARLVQLSPDHLDSVTDHEPRAHAKASKVHVRRLSSTPKQTEAPLSRPAPLSLDVSLEGELLSKGKVRRESQKEKKGTSSKSRSQSNEYPTHLPSPKMSRIVVDTSRYLSTPGSSKKRSSSSVMKGASPSPARANKRKKRGLSVSFVDNDEESPSVLKRNKGNLRPESHHSKTKPDLGTSLIESLNSSRYGALDRSLSQTRKQGRFPRKYAGGDPRLGYDWIAGLLDASEAYLSEKDDEYFEDIKEFRRVNHADCFRPKEAMLPGSLEKEGEGEGSSDNNETSTHSQDHGQNRCTTCMSSYVMNDRLFPMLVHSSSGEDALGVCCPVCEGKFSHEDPPTRYIRVSVPRSVLQASYKVRPHRRRSFDPTDSMGLAKHCLAGWENAQPSIIPPQSKVDLKSAVKPTVRSGSDIRAAGIELLNTSHSMEYSLRSRATEKR